MASEAPKGAQRANSTDTVVNGDAPAAAAPVAPPDAAVAPAAPALAGFVVAAGNAISGTLRGQINEGEAIAARDLAGGQERFDELVSRGTIVPACASVSKLPPMRR